MFELTIQVRHVLPGDFIPESGTPGEWPWRRVTKYLADPGDCVILHLEDAPPVCFASSTDRVPVRFAEMPPVEA